MALFSSERLPRRTPGELPKPGISIALAAARGVEDVVFLVVVGCIGVFSMVVPPQNGNESSWWWFWGFGLVLW